MTQAVAGLTVDAVKRGCCCLLFCLGLQAVLDAGISSIAVVLKHAAIFPEHEKLVGQLARDMGFKQVMTGADLEGYGRYR